MKLRDCGIKKREIKKRIKRGRSKRSRSHWFPAQSVVVLLSTRSISALLQSVRIPRISLSLSIFMAPMNPLDEKRTTAYVEFLTPRMTLSKPTRYLGLIHDFCFTRDLIRFYCLYSVCISRTLIRKNRIQLTVKAACTSSQILCNEIDIRFFQTL